MMESRAYKSPLQVQAPKPQTRAHLHADYTPVVRTTPGPLKISRTLLLGVYSIIPVAFFVALVDLILFNGELRKKLPYSPDNLLLFAVFFNLPHIVASSICFVDVEYLKHFRARVFAPVSALILSLIFLPSLFQNPVFSVVLYLWTVVHVIGQQFGMIRLIGKNSVPWLDHWKWLAIVLGTAVYFGTYVPGQQIGRTNEWVREVTVLAGWVICVPFTALGIKIYRDSKSILLKKSVAANFFMMLSVLALYSLKYSFFLILIPRFIHDISALIFYSAHDFNRNRLQARNAIYGALISWRLPMRLLSPAVALMVALPVTYFFIHEVVWAYRIAVALTLMHYYTDRFVWKSGSPLRASIYLN